MIEQTLIILKPDAVQRRLLGRIIQRVEDAGLKIHALRLQMVSSELSRQHYSEHVTKDFYPSVERYITSGPVVVMVVGGFAAINKIRQIVGSTIPAQANPGTIRGDWAHQGRESAPQSQSEIKPIFNLIHASASPAEAKNEIALWFSANELIAYPLPDDYLHGL